MALADSRTAVGKQGQLLLAASAKSYASPQFLGPIPSQQMETRSFSAELKQRFRSKRVDLKVTASVPIEVFLKVFNMLSVGPTKSGETKKQAMASCDSIIELNIWIH